MAEYTSGRGASWREALRRATRVLRPRHARHRRWSVVVPLIAALAGLLFTTSARTAAGTNLRDDRRPELTRLILERRTQIDTQAARAADIQRRIDQKNRERASSDEQVAAHQLRADQERADAGFTGVHGPGIFVSLNDAPRRADGSLPTGARPDDVIVHQQDVQSVVNALWAGGAEAMTIQGIRVISTSAVRCVGNTLLLHGQVFSPPFEIRAIGDVAGMRAGLDSDPGVRSFRDASAAWGLGYTVRIESDVVAPAYSGSVTLDFATVAR